jgi:hypothetical protein
LKVAPVEAVSALKTLILSDNRPVAGIKIVHLQYRGLQQQVQVCGIHVGVAEHLIVGQCGQGPHQAGLAGAAFTA